VPPLSRRTPAGKKKSAAIWTRLPISAPAGCREQQTATCHAFSRGADGADVRLITREVFMSDPAPRSRISAYSALPPYTEAFTLTLLIVPLLTHVLKLAAARIARQLAQ